MYIINLKFESNIKGIYTKEEETANDEEWLLTKIERMIDKWFNILFPYMDSSKLQNRFDILINKHIIYDIEDKINYRKIKIKKFIEFINMLLNYEDSISNEKESLQKRSFRLEYFEI